MERSLAKRQSLTESGFSSASKGRKRPWSEEEDSMVVRLVEEYGPQKWTFIAEHLPGRIGKQCRERWHNHLNPRIKKDQWTDHEEWVLYLIHKTVGNKWAEIAKVVPGRTDNSIKNHWNSSMKKKIPEFYAKFVDVREAWMTKQGSSLGKGFTSVEKNLLEQLFTMGDMDFHSQNGLNPDISRPKMRGPRGVSQRSSGPSQGDPSEKGNQVAPKDVAVIQEWFSKMLRSRAHKEILEQLSQVFKTDQIDQILSPENLKNPEIIWNLE